MHLASRRRGKITGMAPVSLIVIGAGQRGAGYARWALRHPDRASVVAVAEPSPVRRARLAAEHGIPAGNVAAGWRDLAGRARLADAVLICTQDRMHAEPAEAFAALGYHILLEKPMAPDEAGCRRGHREPRADLLGATRVTGQSPDRPGRRASAAERHGRDDHDPERAGVTAQPATTCTFQVWPPHGVDTITSRPALVSRTV